ncbi:hypothetical protein B4U79_09949, partial [Dinothrombium tinctorium]
SSPGHHRKFDDSASAAVSDLLYYGGMTSGAGIDRGTRCSSSHRTSSGQSLLCRCVSGGALLPPPSPPPPTSTGSSFARGAQSLPSTPNACRRPLSPPSSRPFRLDISGAERTVPSSRELSASSSGPPPPPPPPVSGLPPPLPRDDQQQQPCYGMFGTSTTGGVGSDCGPVGMSDSTVLAGDMAQDDDRTGGNRVQPFQQWTQQRRSLRYRTTSQPLMKFSTLLIVVIAFVIIGFIVLSPLFHYFM